MINKIQQFAKQNLFKCIVTLICLSCLTACGGGGTPYNKVEMSTNYQVHKALKVNVLSFKSLPDNKEVPRLSAPSEGYKYIAIRLIVSNPGENRGLENSSFGRVIDKVELYNPGYNKPFSINKNSMFENLADFRSGDRGIAYAELKPGDSKTAWILGTIPKDANPPFTFKLTPSKRVGTVRAMEVNLNSF